MARKHAFVLALALGLAAAVGAFAAVKTARLGQPQAKASTVAAQTVALLKRQKLLDRQEIALRRALTKRPPSLPKVPRFAPLKAPAAAPVAVAATPVAAPLAAPQRVQYVRPAPIVVVKHRSHGEDGGYEHEGGGGGDD
jgi:hypothetical protein